jgi:hypothetical protein
MCLRIDEKVPVGAPIRVDLNDAMYLGESCFCKDAPGGGYFVGLKLEQVLHELDSLQSLAGHLLKDEAPSGRSPTRGSLKGH